MDMMSIRRRVMLGQNQIVSPQIMTISNPFANSIDAKIELESVAQTMGIDLLDKIIVVKKQTSAFAYNQLIAKDFINNITTGSQKLARWRNNGFSAVQQGNTSDAVVAVQGDEYWMFDYNKLPTAVITLTADQSFSYNDILLDYLLQKIPSTGRYIGILATQGRTAQYYFRYVVVIDGKSGLFRLVSNNGNTDMLLASQSFYRTYLSAGDVIKVFEF